MHDEVGNDVSSGLLFSQVARTKDDYTLRRENRCGETSTTTN
jgi:hypothetical protein